MKLVHSFVFFACVVGIWAGYYDCDVTWTRSMTVPRKCYKFVKDFQPYMTALKACRSFHRNATLLVIESAFENSEYVQDAQAQYNSYWIGLNCIGNPYHYTWIDGSPLNYLDWDISNPNNLQNWYCAYLNTYSTRWWTWDCTVGQMYACQYYMHY